MKRDKFETERLKNKQMSPAVYRLRREVIALIYEAKRLWPDLPRIEVRVTEDNAAVCGVGRMGKRIIWITESFVADRLTVFHEILHAAYAVPHIDGCPLMSPVHTGASQKYINRAFVKHCRAAAERAA